jgi:hypothetical protein
MAKRFTCTDKWRKKFIKNLKSKYKLFWLYILDDCNHAGIWHVDMEVASIRIGAEIKIDEALKYFKEKIIVIDNDKWFIPSFIEFQYGNLNSGSRIHNSVIDLLKKYKLLKRVQKELANPLQRVKDKDKDKYKEKDKENKGLKKTKTPKKIYGKYKHVRFTKKEYKNLLKKWGKSKLQYMIKLFDEGIEMKGYKYKNHNLAIQKWEKRQQYIPDEEDGEDEEYDVEVVDK